MYEFYPPWRTIDEVNQNPMLNHVKIGDDVAIDHTQDATDWVYGIVTGIEAYKNNATRFQERPVLVLDCHTNGSGERRVLEHHVKQIVFKT